MGRRRGRKSYGEQGLFSGIFLLSDSMNELLFFLGQ
jgi:hypothetical protein